MKLRPVIFWSHLVIGCAAGIVILVLSVTGVLLTYERQIVELVERRYTVTAPTHAESVPIDEIIADVRERHTDEHHFFLKSVNREGAAIPVWAGMNGYLVNPYTGELLRDGPGVATAFFYVVTQVHRWFAIGGDGRAVAQAVTAYSNLLFLFLIVTGAYLWLPRVWRWRAFKMNMFLNPKATNTKARHYNWHHVFSFWALIPLFFIVLTATVFYFPWANSLLYGAFGEQRPVQEEVEDEAHELPTGEMSYQELLARAKAHAADNGAADWHSIWMEFGETPGRVRFYIDRSLGRRPEYAYALFLDHDSGKVLEVKRHGDWSRGDQAWDLARFGHTGEWWGFGGQTVAGLASLAACLLVYTGFSLAWRRLVAPRLSRSTRVTKPSRERSGL
ncbi:MAG: PepSY-associated TM helix domain-containing protein [Pseudomonadota bacterium]